MAALESFSHVPFSMLFKHSEPHGKTAKAQIKARLGNRLLSIQREEFWILTNSGGLFI